MNRAIEEALAFLADGQFAVPPFATWSPEQWQNQGIECREIVEQQLGWDVTDFGTGDFATTGLLLLTLRNGVLGPQGQPMGKAYCEKALIVQEGQITPCHFHFYKIEDIINRGGGNLVIQMWNATDDDQRADTPVMVSCDGVRTAVPAGGKITLTPGTSVTLPQRNYHSFWGEVGSGTVLVGEVSGVNDDHVDNRFFDAIRFSEIEEDQPPTYLLSNDYAKFYPHCR